MDLGLDKQPKVDAKPGPVSDPSQRPISSLSSSRLYQTYPVVFFDVGTSVTTELDLLVCFLCK